MSSRKSSTKRKRKQEGDSTEEDSAAPAEYTVFGGWLDDGFVGEDGVTEHEGFSLTLRGKSFEISLGDAVLMRNTDDDGAMESQESAATKKDSAPSNGSKANGNGMIARVERIWEVNHKSRGDECPFMFQARWFLRVSFNILFRFYAKSSSTYLLIDECVALFSGNGRNKISSR